MSSSTISYPGPPTAGTGEVNDDTTDSNGVVWYCSVAGSPGTWTSGESAYLPLTGGTLTGVVFPVQATTVGKPAYVKGGIYFDLTLNKLRVGGATAWETVTSA